MDDFNSGRETHADLTVSEETQKGENGRAALIKFLLFLLMVALILIAGWYTNLEFIFKPEIIKGYIQSAGFLAPFLYILIYALVPSLLLPRFVLAVTGGLLFDNLLGTIYTLIGANCSATIGFYISRYFGKDITERVIKGKLLSLDEKTGDNGFIVILFLRLTPLVAFNLINFMAGISKIKYKDFMLATFFGIIPGTFAYVYLGSSLTDIYSRHFLFAILFFIFLILISIYIKKYRKSVQKD